MIEFILAAFLYARYKMKYNILLVFKHWSIYLPMLFLLIYIYFEINIWLENYWFSEYQQWFKTATLLSYIPLCIKYKLYDNDNILISPMMKATYCLFFGSMLNRIAIWANNGYMMSFPSNTYWTGYVKPEMISDGLHVIGDAYTSAIPICNIWDLGYTILSPGDIFCRFYVFIILYYSIKNAKIILTK